MPAQNEIAMPHLPDTNDAAQSTAFRVEQMRYKEETVPNRMSSLPSTQATQPTYTNPRRWRRFKLSVPLRVILTLPNRTRILDSRGNELSEGGMALTAGVELGVGDRIMVEFTPPYTGLPIRVKGEVRNRQGYRYGIEFVKEGTEQDKQVGRLRAVLEAMAHTE